MRDVARAVGRPLVAPLIDPLHIPRYFGDFKGFEAVDEVVSIVTEGLPVNAVEAATDLERGSRYGNHRGVTEHLPAEWNQNRGRHKTIKMCIDHKVSRARKAESEGLPVG